MAAFVWRARACIGIVALGGCASPETRDSIRAETGAETGAETQEPSAHGDASTEAAGDSGDPSRNIPFLAESSGSTSSGSTSSGGTSSGGTSSGSDVADSGSTTADESQGTVDCGSTSSNAESSTGSSSSGGAAPSETSSTGTSTDASTDAVAPVTDDAGSSSTSGSTGGDGVTDPGTSTTSLLPGASTSSDEAGTASDTPESSGGGSSTGDGGTTTGTDGGGIDPDAPCETVIALGHTGLADVAISMDRFLTRGAEGRAILRDATTLDPISVHETVEWAALAGNVYVVRRDDALLVYDATTGAWLGEIPAAEEQGLATDGSYLWTAGSTELAVFEPTGQEIWFQPGDFSQVRALALGGSLHVVASPATSTTALHLDLATLDLEEVAFAGTFQRWFADRPRFITAQGSAYRVYEEDGSLLLFDLLEVDYGTGDWIVVRKSYTQWAARTLDAPSIDVVTFSSWVPSGSALATYSSACSGQVIVLGDGTHDVVSYSLSDCPSFSVSGWSFAYDGGSFLLSRTRGLVHDHLDRALSGGETEFIDGSISGRFAASDVWGTTRAWDHLGGCVVQEVAELVRPRTPMRISEDGQRLLGVDKEYNQNGLPWYDEVVRIIGLPQGNPISSASGGGVAGSFAVVLDFVASDDATSVSVRVDADPYVRCSPGWLECALVSPISPDGHHVLYVGEVGLNELGTALSYLYSDGDFVDVLDGAAHGFLDDERFIVGHYDDSDTFMSSTILATDGSFVQDTTLPDTLDFHRVTATELLVNDPPRIYDAYAGDLLWTGVEGTTARPVGADHVLYSDGGRVAITRWRP